MFRFIPLFIVALSTCAVLAQDREVVRLPKPDRDGWIVLFNGKDLEGWQGDPNVWRVADGYISGKADSVSHNTFLVYNYPFSNFVLQAKWMLIKAGKFPNSGIQYRSAVVDWSSWVVAGYQADIGEGYSGALYEERGKRGTIFKSSADATRSIRENDWNQYEIRADGLELTHVLNGITVNSFNDQDEMLRRISGVIALQYHAPGGFEIRFKDIRIKPIVR